MPDITAPDASAESPAPSIAPVWARFAALLLDGFLWMPLAFAVAYVSSVSLLPWGLVLFPAGLVGFVVYQVLMHAYYGATLGKMILRLRVVRADDLGPIDFTDALKRSFVDAVLRLSTAWIAAQAIRSHGGALPNGDVLAFLKILQAHQSYISLSNFGAVWAISEVLTCLLNPRRRSLHDLIGGTVVVRIPKNS